MRLAGRASGRTSRSLDTRRLRRGDRRGHAHGRDAGRGVAPTRAAAATRPPTAPGVAPRSRGPFSPHNAARARADRRRRSTYTFDGRHVRVRAERFATAETYVAFEGATDWGQDSRLPFHVTSSDWQESHRFLAGIMTMVATPTAAVPLDGVGEFDGVMPARSAIRASKARSAARPCAPGTSPGATSPAQAVIENAYALRDATSSSRTARRADGRRRAVRARLPAPRRRRGDRRPHPRHRVAAHRLSAPPSSSTTTRSSARSAARSISTASTKSRSASAASRSTAASPTTSRSPRASTSLRFEGAGVRLDGLEVQKAGGTITGAAYVGWDGDLLVQRRRPPPGRGRARPHVFPDACRRSPASPTSAPPAAAPSTSRATTSRSASSTSSSATRASAR